MKVLITGATGFIGNKLAHELANQNYIVHALYRAENKRELLNHQNIILFKGDITNLTSLERAMVGCKQVFHLAAYAKVWSRNKNTFHDINYLGTINVLETAIKQGVEKVLVTSTAGVFGPSVNGKMVNEQTIREVPYFSEYERTKDLADQLIKRKYSTLINVCIVCPTRVYGPGQLSESNSVTKLIKMYSHGKFRFIPGNGKSVGNYVYINDVITGMLDAIENGKSGERYILGGDNLSFNDLFRILSMQIGKNYRLIKVNARLLILIAAIMKGFAVVTRVKPLLTPGWAKKYLYDWIVSSQKASSELKYNPINGSSGISKTLDWLNDKK